MSFELTGKLHKIFPTENKSDTFQVRDFVIEVTSERYPQMIKFQLTQDKCDIVDKYAEGVEVKVSFDLRGREWQGKYFTNLNAWKVEGAQSEAQIGDPGPQEAVEAMPPLEEDDLPF